jgi:hypothetical protein
VGSVVTLKIPSTEARPAKETEPRQSKTNRSRMTEARIAEASPPTRSVRYIYDLDVPRLALRLTSRSIRTFVLFRKISGRAQRITLGRWPGLRLAEARRAAIRINGEIAAGRDPVAERKAARAKAETCNDFWPEYLAKIKRSNRSWARDESRWKRNIAPKIGRRGPVLNHCNRLPKHCRGSGNDSSGESQSDCGASRRFLRIGGQARAHPSKSRPRDLQI